MIGSLTGGGGLSNSSSAGSGTGDQAGNNGFHIGTFNGQSSGGFTNQQLMIGGGVVLVGLALYAFSKKKR